MLSPQEYFDSQVNLFATIAASESGEGIPCITCVADNLPELAAIVGEESSADELLELQDWATAGPANLRELERLADIRESLDRLTALKTAIARPVSAFGSSMRKLAIAAGTGAVAVVSSGHSCTTILSDIVVQQLLIIQGY